MEMNRKDFDYSELVESFGEDKIKNRYRKVGEYL